MRPEYLPPLMVSMVNNVVFCLVWAKTKTERMNRNAVNGNFIFISLNLIEPEKQQKLIKFIVFIKSGSKFYLACGLPMNFL